MKKLKTKHTATDKRTADIIQAALKCFTELGFNDTSMSDICAMANASIGSIYHHFKSKEQLAAAVYLEGIKSYQSGILGILEKEDKAFEGISSIVEYHLRWIRKNPEWSQFLFQKIIHSSLFNETEETLLSLNKNFVTGISDWFKPHMAAGTIRTLSWDLLISLLLGPCQEYTKLYLSKKAATSITDAAHELSLAVWHSLSTEK